MIDQLAITLSALMACVFCVVVGYEIGKRRGIAQARDDMELRKLEAEWMREQSNLMKRIMK